MATSRTVDQKVGDWLAAYNAVAAELTSQELIDRLNAVMHTPLPTDEAELVTFTARMNASMGLARLISANNRAAATVAALITQTGIKPAAIDYGDDT